MADKRAMKKTSSRKPAKQAAGRAQSRGIALFYRETIGELNKVSWPTRDEAIGLTKVVVWVMLLMALVLGGLDWGFYKFFEWLFAL